MLAIERVENAKFGADRNFDADKADLITSSLINATLDSKMLLIIERVWIVCIRRHTSTASRSQDLVVILFLRMED